MLKSSSRPAFSSSISPRPSSWSLWLPQLQAWFCDTGFKRYKICYQNTRSSATLASSGTKHLILFSAKIIYAEHICDCRDFKMFPIWQMFLAYFSFNRVHNLFNRKNKEMCLRKSNSLPTSLHFEPIISSCSLQKLVTEMGLSDSWVFVFFRETEMFILLVHGENHTQVLRIQNSHWKAGSYLWRKRGFFWGVTYIFSVSVLCELTFSTWCRIFPSPTLHTTMLVDNFLKGKKDRLFRVRY